VLWVWKLRRFSRRPVVESDPARTGGSEILIPLRHAAAIVGVWSVRHSRPGMYRDADAELLDLLAPQLAVSLVLGTLARPLGEYASQTVSYVRRLTDTTDTVRQGFSDVAQHAARAEQDARRAMQEREQLAAAVAAGRYKGAPRQTALPGFE